MRLKSFQEFREWLENTRLMPDEPYIIVTEKEWNDMYKLGLLKESAEEKIERESVLWQETLNKISAEIAKEICK